MKEGSKALRRAGLEAGGNQESVEASNYSAICQQASPANWLVSGRKKDRFF